MGIIIPVTLDKKEKPAPKISNMQTILEGAGILDKAGEFTAHAAELLSPDSIADAQGTQAKLSELAGYLATGSMAPAGKAEELAQQLTFRGFAEGEKGTANKAALLADIEGACPGRSGKRGGGERSGIIF